MALRDIQQRLKTWNLDREVEKVVNQNPAEIIKRNQKQLSFGFSSDGRKLGEYRSDEYAQYKHFLNPYAGYGNVDLYVTGDYFRAFQAAARGGKLSIYSTDGKAAKLEKQYGKDRIYGLDDDQAKDYRGDVLKPKISESFRLNVLR